MAGNDGHKTGSQTLTSYLVAAGLQVCILSNRLSSTPSHCGRLPPNSVPSWPAFVVLRVCAVNRAGNPFSGRDWHGCSQSQPAVIKSFSKGIS